MKVEEREKKRCLTAVFQALESGQWTVKAQAVRAMGTVATKLGGTINPQVILLMLKGTVSVKSSDSLCSLIHNGTLETI